MARLTKKAAQSTAANLAAAAADTSARHPFDFSPAGGGGNGHPTEAAVVAEVPATAEERFASLMDELNQARALLNRQAAVICQANEDANELRQSRRRVEDLRLQAETAKQNATVAKKAHELSVEDHFRLEEELASGQQKLPFPPPEDAATPAVAPPGDDDEDWQSVLLEELEIPTSGRNRLADAGITTLGHLCDWTAPPPQGKGKLLTDVVGIGSVTAEKILDACMVYWRRQNDAELAAGCREAEAIKSAIECDDAIRDGLLDDAADPIQDEYADESEGL